MEELPYDKLPLGFRFRPTDEQLINHYLKRKINGTIQPSESWVIPEIDLCRNEPWDLPSKWPVKPSDLEWFFFAAVDRKYPSGNRSNRATEKGYWKATGKDRLIKSKKVLVGMKKTLVFHIGRAPKGIGSCWTMHEYRVANQDGTDVVGDEGAFVLCRLFKKDKETTTELENEANILNEEFTKPINQASPNSELLDKPHDINPENTYGHTTESNISNDEVLPYSVPTTIKPEQSHNNSDTTTDVGNHQEDESLFDGLKDFLGPDYELYLQNEAPQNYPIASDKDGESIMDTDNLLAMIGFEFQSGKASSSYETEINIRHRKPENSDGSSNYSAQQGTADRRIKLERVKHRKVKKQAEIEPPVTPPIVPDRSSKSDANDGRIQDLSFQGKIGVIVVIVMALCAGAIWILAS